jgi:hypothetical protein
MFRRVLPDWICGPPEVTPSGHRRNNYVQ